MIDACCTHPTSQTSVLLDRISHDGSVWDHHVVISANRSTGHRPT